MPGASARTIESEATSRLEGALARVSGVRHLKSRSSAGWGQLTLELDRNADIEVTRFETAMTIRQIWNSMPDKCGYPQIRVRQVNDNAARPFMSYTVNSGQTPPEIMRYANDNISPELSRIPGVAKVELSGAMPMEWYIEYDNDLMTRLGIAPAHIRNAISAWCSTEFLDLAVPNADDDSNWIRLSIAGNDNGGELDLSRITVTSRDGQIITLDKIAKAVHTEASPSGYFRINGLNSIYLNITSAEDANQITLSREIRECLRSMQLPEGYMLNLSYDASERIASELDRIYFRTGLTVLILLVFVAIITLSWRYLMLITISLAINMSVAVVAYYLLGVEIQLYSLAGITISLNLIIDNLIVMTEHITRRRNLRAFSAVLAATLTTVGALSVVFFLDEKTMLSLKDFVTVVIVNLTVSLLVALFLVPALIDMMDVRKRKPGSSLFRRLPLWLARIYKCIVKWLCRHRKPAYVVFVLAFGLPVFMLPEKIDGDGLWHKAYNATFGTQFYKNGLKPWVDICLGGTLRLFSEKVYNGRYYNRENNEPVLYINATLPNGATLPQMNALMQRMEVFLSREEGVRQFQTSISGPRRGSITVFFKPDYQRGGYPYRLKSEIISKALTIGGGSWGVYGLEDFGFNNDVRESAGNYRIRMTGYNYDELYARAEQLRDSLLNVKRIREVTLNSEFSYWKDDYTEFYLDIDRDRLAADSLTISDIYTAINHDFGRDILAATIAGPNGSESVRLTSASHRRDVWGLMNVPLSVGSRMIKLSDYATIGRRQAPPDVIKEDQEYVLCLQYEYIGSSTQGNKVCDRILEQFIPLLPLGYHAERPSYDWYRGDEGSQYALLVLVAAIIFFISAILFNSLRQPLAIIFVIPVSFIGVFLTFYLFDLKFDQGGFAAFILLCGITVNAAIYIINEYNSLRGERPAMPALRLYLRAFRTKITAVMLTVLSTVLGFIPFLIGDTQEGFWFPLAAGTMGGLIMSLVAIFVFLPILILPRKSSRI